MSNPNHTLIVMLVDASGSMSGIRQNTIDGINTFIAQQKTATIGLTGEDRPIDLSPDLSGSIGLSCSLTLVTFSTPNLHSYGTYGSQSIIANGEPVNYDYSYNILYNNADIHLVNQAWEALYQTDGGTPLLDAFCKCIEDTKLQVSQLPPTRQPGRVIFVAITDGQENTSKAYSRVQLNAKIKDMTDNHNWQFVFLGANQDAIAEAQTTGIAVNNSMSYQASPIGIADAFASTSDMVMNKRRSSLHEMSNTGYSVADYSRQDKLLGSAINMRYVSSSANPTTAAEAKLMFPEAFGKGVK